MRNITPLPLIGLLVLAGPALAAEDGQQLYDEFSCDRCHGTDAKATPQPGMVPLAGMDKDELTSKARRIIEQSSHETVSIHCGTAPSAKELNRMAEYIAALPR